MTLRWFALRPLVMLALLMAALVAACPALARTDFLALAVAAEDDPKSALANAQAQHRAATDPMQRFWLLLAQARALNVLEANAAAAQVLVDARAWLLTVPGAAEEPHHWLELEALATALLSETAAQVNTRLERLREVARRVQDPKLRCAVIAQDNWFLIDSGSLDEAWIAAEQLEKCALAIARPDMLALALANMGNIVAELPREQRQGRVAADYLARALAALGPEGLRYRRSVVEYDLARAHAQELDGEQALRHLRNALALSETLADVAGMGAAHIELARVHLDRAAPLLALQELDLAYQHLHSSDAGGRILTVARFRLQALTQLNRPDVLNAIEQARSLDREEMPLQGRARLARAMAAAYASREKWREAYVESQRASGLDDKARSLAADTQVLRLQFRYDGVRRDAETAELRHREEAARLALQAESARQRALWVALALLLVVLAGAGGWLRVQAQRRRVLHDLALKDELTGAPNRRAVSAYAQAQLAQTRQLDMAITLGVIDLDHFKRVNDQHGHAAGDALLCAFARAAQGVLRGQDRLGRWGGEEWLLVMPGTPQAELPQVFDRLREAFASAVVPGMPQPHGCTFSMGAMQWHGGAQTLDELVAQADRQLYEAKQGGRDQLRLAA